MPEVRKTPSVRIPTLGKDCISKRGQLCDRFRPSIERSGADAHIFGPMRNQAPTHRCKSPHFFSVFSSHRKRGLRGRDVVSRSIIEFARRSEPLGQSDLGVSQSVAVAHDSFQVTEGCFGLFFLGGCRRRHSAVASSSCATNALPGDLSRHFERAASPNCRNSRSVILRSRARSSSWADINGV